ncbi:hypothetical protein GQ607_008380 [Colletotrichum asianum]|uniref:Taurine catabolism dioxygenase n=1 Tax=Colletotrichum asianum TaxID=702518 RepID=A0A8H3ZSB4_9PEZI|nr:hypothetical protein GQ607_008380 [Colletotrichum asianum]
MHAQELVQIQLGAVKDDSVHLAAHHIDFDTLFREEEAYRSGLLDLCPEHLWHNGSYLAGCPRPILVSKSHQQQMEYLHEALVISIIDIVQRWWTDKGACFPKRMPLEPEEEELLRWIENQVSLGNMATFSDRLGSWRPDFLVEDDAEFKENYRITEINARFSFNGFVHEAYGQDVLNKTLESWSGVLVGATDANEILNGLFDLFRQDRPLHLLKGAEPGIDIHMFIKAVESRFGIRPRLITPQLLRLLPDSRIEHGYPMDPEILRQVSLRCFNDMRTILLVHDKRMLGIIKQEVPGMLGRGVLNDAQAAALNRGIVETILPGSPELNDLINASVAAPQMRFGYILKPTRSGKGDGIVFGDDLGRDEWMSTLKALVSSKVVPGVTCVVQRRIVPREYDLVLKAAVGRVRYPLVGTYHVTNGKLLGLGTWRASGGRIVAVCSGGSWICSVIEK